MAPSDFSSVAFSPAILRRRFLRHALARDLGLGSPAAEGSVGSRPLVPLAVGQPWREGPRPAPVVQPLSAGRGSGRRESAAA